ncbi:U6 snRNA phosphodiesterase [Drechslerella dactyloides]|uniref:U6 snRNA phosphodiesterase 1 n=1 Tax=Drechslerella dactyloides TaxID=74499 RepID=A0AAD6ISJ7_DREDA|nr:U6 snRNA phosphodiesterase [Drechslerella dactyloides]
MASSSHQKRPSLGLVDYSDSDNDDAEPATAAKPTESTSLPPLPSKFHDLYTAAPRQAKEDDPSAHGHLNSAEVAKIGHLLSVARSAINRHELFHQHEVFKLESFLYSDLGTQLPLHISMSRPIVLRTDQRDQFIASLERGLNKAGVEPFDAHFTSLDWVPNQDRTRWFWVMRASSGYKKQKQSPLTNLLAMCNSVVKHHGQPGLYLADSRGNMRDGFHVSIGWSLGEPTAQLREDIASAMAGGREGSDSGLDVELSALTMRCETLKVKIGNAVHALELKRAF